MSIAITEDHKALASTAASFLLKTNARGEARALLEAPEEGLPPFWTDLVNLGWLGLHVPEEYGGSGYGLPELVVVVEELGRAVAPGPFTPTVIASARHRGRRFGRTAGRAAAGSGRRYDARRHRRARRRAASTARPRPARRLR